MLFVISLVGLISTIFNSKNVETVRKKLFSFCVIFSLFFFSSYDPFIGMPLYIYPMILSTVITLLSNPKIEKSLLLCFVFLILSAIIPILRMELFTETDSYFLIKASTTDSLQFESQLRIPDVDFIVIKHFVFMVAYALFAITNADLVKDNEYVKSLLNSIIIIFKVLFVGIIVEWIIINMLGGINDRYLMGWIFSLKQINQTVNWSTWGSYSVALWFTERSNFNIVALFYMMYLKKRNITSSDWLWLVVSVAACYCTGSSSCLAILAAFLVLEVMIVIIRNKKISQYIFVGVIFTAFIIILFNNYELFTEKLQIFFSGETTWSSGYFRANSITYGIKAIQNHFLFGVGIGTVLVHSMLVQTLANIGVMGTAFMLYLHCKLCPVKCNLANIISVIFIVGISFGCYMVQNFTSPFLIIIFIILNYKGDYKCRA